MKFWAKIIPSGNATAVEIPGDVMRALSTQARPPIRVTINGHTWRSRVAAMRGLRLIGISAAHRAAAGIAEGDITEVDVEPDEAPRDVIEPADLAGALDASPEARAAFDGLPFGLKQKHVTHVENAQRAEVRSRRIVTLAARLAGRR